jgi:hypothetical protein
VKIRKNLLDGLQCRIQGDLVMSIVRQSTREAMKAAVAACRRRLFGGGVGGTYASVDSVDSVKGSWTTMPMSRVLEPNHCRGG